MDDRVVRVRARVRAGARVRARVRVRGRDGAIPPATAPRVEIQGDAGRYREI